MARHVMDREVNFERALVGYNRQQVDRHLVELERWMADAAAAFDAAIALQKELNEAHAEITKLRALNRGMSGTSGLDRSDLASEMGERITEIMRLAEEQADAIRAQAEQDAQEIRDKARQTVHTTATEDAGVLTAMDLGEVREPTADSAGTEPVPA